jgi:hypothetical protein
MLQVNYEGGWFTVRDLEGTEMRYRKKEFFTMTQSLLNQPDDESSTEAGPSAAEPAPNHGEAPSPQIIPPATPGAGPAPVMAVADDADLAAMEVAFHGEQKHDAAEASGASRSEKIVAAAPLSSRAEAGTAFEPAGQNERPTQVEPLRPPLPETNRQLENKAYFSTLGRIFLIVAASISLFVLFFVLKRR